ncbi:MAG: hypothetical protein VYD64_05925 [Pseudomonadota bacterium]|nr:hypothetical protein [Pseudomonadota bacterium]
MMVGAEQENGQSDLSIAEENRRYAIGCFVPLGLIILGLALGWNDPFGLGASLDAWFSSSLVEENFFGSSPLASLLKEDTGVTLLYSAIMFTGLYFYNWQINDESVEKTEKTNWFSSVFNKIRRSRTYAIVAISLFGWLIWERMLAVLHEPSSVSEYIQQDSGWGAYVHFGVMLLPALIGWTVSRQLGKWLVSRYGELSDGEDGE